MQTKPKSNSVITHEMRDGAIAFVVAGVGEVVVDLSAISSEVRDRALYHGLIQRVSDAAAISRDPETGKSASPADKLAAMKELVDHYNSGSPDWSRRRAGGTGGGREGLLFTALVRLYPGKSAELIREFLKGKSRAEQSALSSSAKVRPIIDSIRAEAGRGIDGDALLDGLED